MPAYVYLYLGTIYRHQVTLLMMATMFRGGYFLLENPLQSIVVALSCCALCSEVCHVLRM